MPTEHEQDITNAVRGFPFVIGHRVHPGTQKSNYTIHDCKGDVWALCTDAGQARAIVEGLGMLASVWKVADDLKRR